MANTLFLGSFVSELKTAFSKGENKDSVIGLDLGSSSLKIVQLKREGGRILLETYGEIALGPYGDRPRGDIVMLTNEQISKAIKDILEAARTTTKRVAIGIRSSSSLLRIIQLNGHLSEQEVKLAIPNESRRYIPVPIEEVSLDWWVLPAQSRSNERPYDSTRNAQTHDGSHNATNPVDPESKTNSPVGAPVIPDIEVMVAAVHRDTLSNYQESVVGASLSTVLLEIEIFSAIRSTFQNEISPVMMIDCGASSTRVVVAEHGIVKKFHVATRGGASLTTSIATSLNVPFEKAEEIKKEYGMNMPTQYEQAGANIHNFSDFLIQEIQSVLLSYEKKYNRPIEKVVLTGGVSTMHGFKEYLSDKLPFPVVAGDAFRKTQTPKFLEKMVAQAGPDFAVSIGLALKALE